MCELCHKTPCHPTCPNAADPEPLYECNVCGNAIYEGEYVYYINDEYWCERCISDCCSIAEAEFEDEY